MGNQAECHSRHRGAGWERLERSVRAGTVGIGPYGLSWAVIAYTEDKTLNSHETARKAVWIHAVAVANILDGSYVALR